MRIELTKTPVETNATITRSGAPAGAICFGVVADATAGVTRSSATHVLGATASATASATRVLGAAASATRTSAPASAARVLGATANATHLRMLLLSALAILGIAFCCAVSAAPQHAGAATGDFTHDLQVKNASFKLPESTYPYNCVLGDIDVPDDELVAAVDESEGHGYRILDDYAQGKVIFLAGGVDEPMYECNNSPATKRMVEQFQGMMDTPGFEDIDLVVMQMEYRARDEFKDEFMKYCSDRIRCVSAPTLVGAVGDIWYSTWVDYMFKKFDPDYTLEGSIFDDEETGWAIRGQVVRPVCVYMEDGVVKGLSTGEVSLLETASDAFHIPLSDFTIALDLTPGYDTKAAYEMLDKANAAYEGDGKLNWDSGLEYIAQTLAAEITFSSDDLLNKEIRPNGFSQRGLFQGRLKSSYTRIFFEASDKGEVPDLGYAISDSATSVGAACYKGAEGEDYWAIVVAGLADGGDGKRAITPLDVTVHSMKENVDLAICQSAMDATNSLLPGETKQLYACSSIAPLENYEVTWKSSDKSIATISADGLVTAKKPGKVTITTEIVDDPTIKDTCSIEVEAVEISDDNAWIELGKDSYVETGKAIKPSVKVMYWGDALVNGTDYSVSYSNNVKPGTATVKVTGIGKYAGTLTSTFTITKKKSSSSGSSSGSSSSGSSSASSGSSSGSSSASSGSSSSSSSSSSSASSGSSASSKPSPAVGEKGLVRLGGKDAYETMQFIVREGFTQCDSVVVATFDGYWDALAASSLAGSLKAPVLLTAKNTLSPECLAEMKRLGATTAYIVGGTAAVSSGVEKQIAREGLEVKRLAGSDALDTAVKIATQVGSKKSDTCIIATANGYWDALAASPYSYKTKSPIFLTDFNGELTADVLKVIKAGNYKRAIIAGGTAAVKGTVEKQLVNAGIKSENVQRKWGATAYETSISLAKWGISEGLSADKMGIATLNGYWDALTGAALCGINGSVLVLADDDALQAIEQVMTPNKDKIHSYYIFGGTAAVGTKVEWACKRAAGK
ncbi:MAG: cell wall-binding repeat-containing protein [Eggerthellaceae bacterium]|nr:cell wall-binding repeat-containing protein [Eggerthellaceae bacterium]